MGNLRVHKRGEMEEIKEEGKYIVVEEKASFSL